MENDPNMHTHTHMYIYIYAFLFTIYIYIYLCVCVGVNTWTGPFFLTSVKTDASRPLCLKNHIICMVFICRAIQKHLFGRLRCLLSKDNMLHNVGDCVFLIQPLAQFGRLEGLHVSCFLAGARPSKLRLGTSNMCGSPIDGAEDSPNGEHPTSP